jgi:hypothetical protein
MQKQLAPACAALRAASAPLVHAMRCGWPPACMRHPQSAGCGAGAWLSLCAPARHCSPPAQRGGQHPLPALQARTCFGVTPPDVLARKTPQHCARCTGGCCVFERQSTSNAEDAHKAASHTYLARRCLCMLEAVQPAPGERLLYCHHSAGGRLCTPLTPPPPRLRACLSYYMAVVTQERRAGRASGRVVGEVEKGQAHVLPSPLCQAPPSGAWTRSSQQRAREVAGKGQRCQGAARGGSGDRQSAEPQLAHQSRQPQLCAPGSPRALQHAWPRELWGVWSRTLRPGAAALRGQRAGKPGRSVGHSNE